MGAGRESLLERAALIALVAVMGVTAVALGLVLAEQRLNSESIAFADDAVNTVSLRWDESVLLARATPALAGQAATALDPLFATLRLSAVDAANQGCEGGAKIGFRGLDDPAITAAYDCPLVTQGRNLDVDLRLKKTDGAWKIDGFAVRPPPAR